MRANRESKQAQLHLIDISLEHFDSEYHSWVCWVCFDSPSCTLVVNILLALCGEPLLDALRQCTPQLGPEASHTHISHTANKPVK